MVTLAYQLPSHPPDGRWIIRVEALTQIHDHEIFVERFYYRFFDVYTLMLLHNNSLPVFMYENQNFCVGHAVFRHKC